MSCLFFISKGKQLRFSEHSIYGVVLILYKIHSEINETVPFCQNSTRLFAGSVLTVLYCRLITDSYSYQWVKLIANVNHS